MTNLSLSAKAVVRLAVVLLVVAAVASVWEVFARQAPGSSFSLGVLPGPIGVLRNTSATLGLIFFAVAWVMPWASRPREPRFMVRLAIVGAVLTVSANFYGALNSMYGIQITGLRPDVTYLFAVKQTGHALLGLCLLDLARRVLLYPPP